MAMVTERPTRKINCKEIATVHVEDLLPYHQTGDPKLPMKTGSTSVVDVLKIPGNILLKLAARYAHAKKAVAVQYQHPSASCPKNGYSSTMILVDSSRVLVAPASSGIGKEVIGVNGYLALSPKGRKEVIE